MFSAFFGVYWYGGKVENAKWQAKWSERDTADIATRLQAENEARALEQSYQKTIEEITANGQQEVESIKVRLVSANIESASVQQRANQLAGKLASSSRSLNSCTTASSKAAADTARMLADLFSQADTAAGVMAEVAEQARARGLSCEKAYDGLVANSKKRK